MGVSPPCVPSSIHPCFLRVWWRGEEISPDVIKAEGDESESTGGQGFEWQGLIAAEVWGTFLLHQLITINGELPSASCSLVGCFGGTDNLAPRSQLPSTLRGALAEEDDDSLHFWASSFLFCSADTCFRQECYLFHAETWEKNCQRCSFWT